MASSLHVIAVGPDADRLERALDEIAGSVVHTGSSVESSAQISTGHLAHLEQCWSRFIATSDTTRINQLGRAGGGQLTVDPSTIALLTAMVEGFQRTAGRFDPAVLPALIAAGYAASRLDPSQSVELPDPSAGSGLDPSVEWRPSSWHDVELEPSTNTVTVPSGLVLDPGGIGKGLAADLAVGRLLAAGATGALVEIGGDLAMAGTPPDASGWLVNVERPDPADGLMCGLAVSGGGVATSSTRSRRWTVDGVEHHHQIDPDTDDSSTTDLEAVTVIAPTGWLAEVHATAALAVGSAGVLSYLDGHGLSGIAVVHDDPTMLMTPDIAAIVKSARSPSTGAPATGAPATGAPATGAR